MKSPLLLLAGFALLLVACQQKKPVEAMKLPLSYPLTFKDTTVVDDYFGTKVPDPYRWLENDTSAQTKEWVDAQNALTFQYLESIPFRDKIRERYTELYNYPKYSSPFRIGEYYFFSKNDGLQNQSVTYFQKGLEGKPEVFLDPNQLSEDGTVTASISSQSHDDRYVTISTNRSGSDWQEMKVVEVATKRELSDKLEWLKFSGAAWWQNGFFYSRYDKPAAGKELSAKSEYQKIYYHKLGDSQEQDQLVYEDPKHPLRYFSAQTTEDERFLIVYVSEGTDGSEILYKDLKAGDKDFKVLFKGFVHNYTVIDNLDDKLLVWHNQGAPNYKVSLVEPRSGKMKDFVPEQEQKLESVGTAGGKLFVSYLQDVTTKVYQYDLATAQQEREIKLPSLGSAWGFGGNKSDSLIFYSFTSYTYPETIYKYNISSGESEVFRKSELKFRPEDYETKQVFYPSKDGTKIPMFITYKKGIKLDGTAPTMLYAYGGFNVSITPYFNTSNLILLENGGIYAVANLRGGGEYGEKWHKAGMLNQKQNVFDDFVAAAEYLIKEKYTSKGRLALNGASNGGLLVGAVMTQRPDLCQVVIPQVGVMDMLRFHKFTVGWGWAVEYGSSENKQQFEYLYKYSPLHNLKAGTTYPATLITTADHDDRVVPAHSFKFAATLQEKHRGNPPVLIRIDAKAGHGGGKPTAKIIEEETDIWSFMFYNMGFSPKY